MEAVTHGTEPLGAVGTPASGSPGLTHPNPALEQVEVSKAAPTPSSQGTHPGVERQVLDRDGVAGGRQVLGLGLSPAAGTLMREGLCVQEREGRLSHASSILHHAILGEPFGLFSSL